MKRIISTLFGLAVLCLFAEAHAVPTTVSFTGRLSTTNGPVSGNVNVTFSLFDQATNGTVMWTETRNNLPANNGLVYADLGALTTLDESVLLNAALFLEIQVGAEVLTPRLPLQSVPYSIRSEVANSADTLGGTVTAAQVVTAATGPLAINTGTVALTTCSANQIYKMSGGSWICAADTDTNTTYTAGANSGVVLNTTTFGLMTCSVNQVLKATGAGTWGCAGDTDTTYSATANGGLTFSGSQIGLMTCSVNQVLKSTGVGTWGCATDNDAGGDILGITTAAGSGLDGGCTGGTCTLTVDPTDINATPPNAAVSSVLIDTDYTTGETVTSVTVSAPVPGNVVVFFTGLAYCGTCSDGTNETITGYYTISTSASAAPNSGDYMYTYIRAAPTGQTGNEYKTLAAQDVFLVGAGSTTFYVRAGRVGTTESWYVTRGRLSAIFVPN